MHRILLFAAAAIVAMALAGCGGGGGGSSVVAPPVNNSVAGTWTISSLGLPQNQMMITSGGVVYVNGETPTVGALSTRPLGYYTRIGTCNQQGLLTLSGYWTYGGILHRVLGTGVVNPSSRVVSVTVTLLKDNRIVMQEVQLSGTLANSTPPPLPDFMNGGGNDYELPPPIPSM